MVIRIKTCKFGVLMNNDGLENIIRKNSGKLFNYLLKIVRRREDAEDILHDVWIAFSKKMNNVNPEAMDSYLFRAAYNTALNHIKKAKKTVEFNPQVQENTLIYEEPKEENSGKTRIIREAFRSLPPNHALALELQFYQKKNYREISEIMGITESAVESVLVRAKRNMRQILRSSNLYQDDTINV